MIVWSATDQAADGQIYSVRYLLTPDELAGLQAAGLVGNVEEVVGLQDVADGIVATFERDLVMACGGRVQ